MTLEDWAANHWIVKYATTFDEVKALRAVVERDLKDAQVESISDDRRFATAYNAALQLSKLLLAVAGYRLAKGQGGHEKAFDVVRVILDSDEAESLCDYFDTCRRKRNDIDYDFADVVTQTELEELIETTIRYKTLANEWIENNSIEFSD